MHDCGREIDHTPAGFGQVVSHQGFFTTKKQFQLPPHKGSTGQKSQDGRTIANSGVRGTARLRQSLQSLDMLLGIGHGVLHRRGRFSGESKVGSEGRRVIRKLSRP
jgi:hypothetical protein